MNGNQLAIYWDFENIHISVAKLRDINKTHLNPRTRQDKVIDLAKIMDHLQKLGQVCINRAYGNWQWMGAYQEELLKHSIDLIQMFPAGLHAKNGADIRLALDAFEDACRLPQISHTVIISGDSDFISAAQKLRALGKTVIGIGTREATNQYWKLACSAFEYYENLVPEAATAAKPSKPAAKPKQSAKQSPISLSKPPATESPGNTAQKTPQWLLEQAFAQLLEDSDKNYVLLSQLRPAIVKLDPQFTLKKIGHASMSKFVQAHPDVVRMVNDKGTHRIYSLQTDQPTSASMDKAPEMTPDWLFGLFNDALRDRGVKRLSKAALHQMVMDTKPPLADTSSSLMAKTLEKIPELEITDAFVSLKGSDSKTTDEAQTPLERTLHPELICLNASFTKILKTQGLFWLPPPQWTQVLTATHDYFQENNYEFVGPRPELRDKLLNRCNSETGGPILPRVAINRLISTLIRSQTFDIQHPNEDDRTWTLRRAFRSPDLLIEHLGIFLLYREIQSGHTCTAREWSFFLYGDADHEDYIDSLKIQLFHDDYAVQFEPQPLSTEADSLLATKP